MEIVNLILAMTPSKLDICSHGDERQYCPKCADFSGSARAAEKALLDALCQKPDNPTPRGPVSRKKYQGA